MKTTNCTIAQLHNAQFISVNGCRRASHGDRHLGTSHGASGYTQAPVPVTTASYSLDELAGPVLCEFTETSI